MRGKKEDGSLVYGFYNDFELTIEIADLIYSCLNGLVQYIWYCTAIGLFMTCTNDTTVYSTAIGVYLDMY